MRPSLFGSGCVSLPAPSCSEPASHTDVRLRQSGLPTEARPQRPAIHRYCSLNGQLYDIRHSALPRRHRGHTQPLTLRHRSHATTSRRPRTRRRSQVEQGRLQAGARIARRRHALDDPAEGPVAGHGLREDGRLLRGPRRRRRCGAGLPGLGCRLSPIVRSPHRSA